MHLASRLVQNDHTDRTRGPFHPLDKRYRGGGVPRVGVHFLNDRPRSIEKLDAEPHVNAREDDRPRRPDDPGRSFRTAADRAPSAFGSPCRARPRGLFAWQLILLSHSFFQIRLVLIFDILVIRFIDHGGEDGRRGAS